jgi:uncharacterized membrane protein
VAVTVSFSEGVLVPVNWQDELRQLDQELAAGKVTAEEYRKRRDVVLSQTASSGAEQQPQPQPGQWTRGQQYPPSGPNAIPPVPGDRTQMVSQQPPGPTDADKTQIVSGGQMPVSGNESTQVFGRVGSQPPENPERTQVVSGYGGRQQPGMPPNMGNQQQGDDGPLWGGSNPPWAGGEFQPVGGSRANEPWYSQGPEGFDQRSGSKGKIIAIVGVVVVIAALVVVFFVVKPFSGSGNTSQAGHSTSRTAPPTTTTPAGPLAQIPGSQVPNAVHAFTDVVPLGFLTQEEVAAFQSGQPTTAYFSDTTSGNNKILVLVVQTDSSQSASSVAQQLTQLQINYQMQPRTGGPVGVSIQTADGAQGGPLRRAEYSSGSYVVRIQVQGADPTTVDQKLTSVLNAQLKRLPAND